MIHGTDKYKVAILSNLVPGRGAGGIVTALFNLIDALGKLEGHEEYLLIDGNQDSLEKHIGPNQRIVSRTELINSHTQNMNTIKGFLGPLRKPIGAYWRLLRKNRRKKKINKDFTLPVSNGSYERLGVSVVHFPYQYYIKTKLPSVFSPWDLQYIHYPEFYTYQELLRNQLIYRTGCEDCSIIVVGSQWTKNDIIRHFNVIAEKIMVVPWAPPIKTHETKENYDDIKKKFNLPSQFCFYPAATWPHKNHCRLLEAMAILRDRYDVIVNLVCTGYQHAHWKKIHRKIDELRLEAQVQFLGFVTRDDLHGLYQLASFVVYPSLFEGLGLPLFESWQENTPIACSNTTCLPEIAGNAALTFSPENEESIAEALKLMWLDINIRKNLITNGITRLNKFNWELTAKAHRVIYRKLSNVHLTDEDKWLLSRCI